MVHSISPSLAIRLGSLNGAHVVRFPVVVPGDDFNDVKLVPGANQGFPSFCIEMLVGKVDELKKKTSEKRNPDARNLDAHFY